MSVQTPTSQIATQNFSEAAVELAKKLPDNALFSSVRETGLASFKTMPFPTRKTEAWKYTSLHALTQANYNQPATQGSAQVADSLFAIEGVDAIRVVLVNGVYSDALSSDVETAGLTLVAFSKANEQQKATIAEYLGKTSETERNLFTALNNGCVNEGVFIQVAKNQRIEKPIQLVNITTPQETEATAFARCLVLLENHAEATLIEQFVTTDEVQNSILNQTTEIVIQDGAKLNHYRLNTEHESQIHFGGVYVDLNRDSQFESYQMALGGKIKRLDILVNHNQSGSHCEMKGVYLPKHQQHIDIHSYIEHKAPHCTTDEVYRGIMADKSKAVFNGRIHIHADAQKTLAELSNKNLLLSNQAEINTKPELEIYADDVRCAHGATVAQLDEKARFYLQSRGVSRQEAEVMLSFGFINELLDSIPLEALRNSLRPLLAQQFTSNTQLTQHLLDVVLEGEVS